MESKNSDEHEPSAHDAHLDVTAEEVKIDVQAAVLFAEQKLDPVFQEFSSYQLYVIANADPEHLAGLDYIPRNVSDSLVRLIAEKWRLKKVARRDGIQKWVAIAVSVIIALALWGNPLSS